MECDDTNIIYFEIDKWFEILELFPGIKGLQEGNSKLYLFKAPGSDRLWIQDKGQDNPRQDDADLFSKFKENRMDKMQTKYRYWFEWSELNKYGVNPEQFILSIEDIINDI